MSINADGEIEWQTPKWLQARGSFDQSIAVRRNARDQLEISGSPAKFFQGHNAFGSDDIQGLVVELTKRVCSQLAIHLDDFDIENLTGGYTELLRVDINYSYETGSRGSALAWIRAAEQHGYLQHRGRGMLKGTTVVWGSKSRHWQLKAYCKGQEIEAKDHRLPDQLTHRDQLTQWCNDKLRIEAQFNARYLRERALNLAANWKSETPAVLHSEHLSRLNLTGEMKLQPQEIEGLSKSQRKTYELWAAGVDLRACMSKNTFYTHRRTLQPFGIDIAVAPPNAQRNVVPLIRTIEATPAEIPSWAYGSDVYFEPRRTA